MSIFLLIFNGQKIQKVDEKLKKREATLDDWMELYEAAIKYKELKCWEWMYDTDIFGVQSIDTGEIGYCCVMGNAGEVFGLNVYPGVEGLKSYMDTLYQTVPYEDIAFIQSCITLNFEDRDVLDKKDLEIIKKLGLKFRGKKQWPQFRRYKPGFFPWYLEKTEVNYLKYALEQVIDVVTRCKEDKDIVERENEEEILVRVPRRVDGEVIWEDKYIELEFEEEDELGHIEIDELAVKRLKDSKVRKAGIWEIDFFHAPALVKEGDRPYYPLVFLAADGETDAMLDMFMTSDFTGYIKEFQDWFIQLLTKNKIMPETIVVQRKEVSQSIDPIAKRMGIRVQPVEELIVVQEFRRSLERFL